METRNLIIRPTLFKDISLFAEWEKRPEVNRFFAINDDKSYEETVTDFIRGKDDPTKLFLTITHKPSNEPIGRVILTRIDKEYDSMDITKIYIADSKNRNKGYGTEALRVLLEYGFVQMHMERITIDHFLANKEAAYLYDKLGFQPEGIMRNACKKNGKYYDLRLLSMIRAEYPGSDYER